LCLTEWSKIDNEKTFQRLINHLFALECNSPGFIPSSPYIGADGGWDGYYDGYYPLEDKGGIWSIQSKWTSKNFKEATKSLHTEIKEELKKARINGVDHLRIVTNAELKVGQVKKLEKMGDNEPFTLRVWHREELNRRIELQPYLKYYFFGSPQYPKFVPWNIYFDEVEKYLLPVEATKIDRFKYYLNEAEKFVLLETKNILLIHSPGGYGKSHLLREIAQRVHQIDSGRQPWMARAGIRTMGDALQEEIVSGRKYLLILDDADRYLEEVKPLLSFIRYCNDSIKVILAFRTSGLNYIQEIIRTLRCEELYGEMEISNWSKNDLIQLLRIATGQEKVEDEEGIAAIYANPFLIVWIAMQIKKEPILDFKIVKEKLTNDIEFEAKSCLDGIIPSQKIENFLMNLASIVPFSKEDNQTINTLKQQFDLDSDIIKEAVENLKNAGVLRTIGYSLRFNPDMKGDVYLAYKLDQASNSEWIKRIIQTWVPIFPEKLFINLGASGGYATSNSLKKVLSEIINSWIGSAERTPESVRRERLSFLTKIAHLVPEESLNLMHTYLSSRNPLPSSNKKVPYALNILTSSDDYSPIILALIGVLSIREKVIEIIEMIDAKNMEGRYNNYKPEALIERFVSPLYNIPSLIMFTLCIFSKWLDKPNKSRSKLVSLALSEVLAGSHQYIESTINGMTIGEKVMKDTLQISKVRDMALDILKKMIHHPLLEIQLLGIQVAEKIGVTSMGRPREEKLPLSDRIAFEHEMVVSELWKLVSLETDFQLLSAIEDLFLKWWAQKTPGTNKVDTYLRKFPREPEYIVFRYFASPDYAIENFDLIEKQAPKENRYKWLIDNFMFRDYVPEDFQALAEFLNKKYNTENKVVAFLIGLDEKVSRYKHWGNPPIIPCWAKLSPKLFLSIRGNNELWKKVPQRFKREIDLSLGKIDERIIAKLWSEILSKLPNASSSDVDTFLILVKNYPDFMPNRFIRLLTPIIWVINKSYITYPAYSCLMKLIKEGNSEIRTTVIHHLYFIFKDTKEINPFIKLLNSAILRERRWDNVFVSTLSFVVSKMQKRSGYFEGKLLKEFRKNLLQKLRSESLIIILKGY